MKKMIKYLLGVVVGVLMCSATAFAENNPNCMLEEGEYVIENTDIIMYTVPYRNTPANIGVHIVGITNKGNFVSKYWCENYYIYDSWSPDRLSPTFNPEYGTQIDQATAYQRLIALKDVFPEGMPWDESKVYNWTYEDHGVAVNGIACSAYALQVSDLVFGVDAPSFSHSDYDNIKVGDIISIIGINHDVVALEVHDDYVIVTEGNYNGTVHWGWKIKKTQLEKWNTSIKTRY